MQLLRRDTDLGTQAQLPTVRKARRGVHSNSGGINTRTERPHGGNIRGHNTFRMTGGVPTNMLDRLIDVIDDAHREVHRQVFRLPVGLRRIDDHVRVDGRLAVNDCAGGLVGVNRDARGRQARDRSNQEALGDIGVHQRCTRPRAASLRS